MQQDLTPHDVVTRQVPFFDRQGRPHQVTQVTFYAGDHGPFSQLFGEGQALPDTIVAINQWKADIIAKLQATS